MSTMKRCISLLLTAIMVLSMVPGSALAANTIPPQKDNVTTPVVLTSESGSAESMGTTTDGLEYAVYSDHVEITAYTGSARALVIPAEIEGLPVTRIGDYAFEGRGLVSINIPNGVTHIGDSAFKDCWDLYTINYPSCVINIPSSVTSIGDSAFENCRRLTSINIPSSVTSIGVSTFKYCRSLASINIPSSVTSIGDYAFYFCSSLTGVNIPSGVTSIGDSTFSGCSNLTSINIPNGVTTIGVSAFKDCSSLTGINIPSGVTSIGDSAFSGCSNLTSINIPNSVTTIGVSTFKDCSSLTGINIPSGVTSIGDSTFSGCCSLASIKVDPNNSTYASLDGILYNKDMTELITCPEGIQGSIVISNGVTHISVGEFDYCTSLTSVTIPASVSSFGETAGAYYFRDCSNLEAINVDSENQYYCSVDGVLMSKDQTKLFICPPGKAGSYVVPDTVTFIKCLAFGTCTKLTDVTIGDSVTNPTNWIFHECSSLKSVTLGRGITEVHEAFFGHCESLEKIIFCGDAPNFDDRAFGYGDSEAIVATACKRTTISTLTQ